MKLKLFLLQVCLASVFSLAYAQNQVSSVIPREVLFDNPKKTAPKISPDGTKLAYLAPDEQNVLNVWIRNLEHPAVEKKITSDSKRGIHRFLWQFDGMHILYLQDSDGDENHHLYQTNIQTQKTRDLTPHKGCKVGLVDYNPKFPDDLLIQTNQLNPSLFDIYRLDLQTGKSELDTKNPGDVLEWLPDNDLCVRVAKSFTKDGSILIRTRSSKNEPWRELLTIGPDELRGSLISFTEDNQAFYSLTSLYGDTARLLKIDASTGKSSVVFEDKKYDIDSVLIDPTNYALEAIGIDKERYEWIALASDISSDFQYLSQTLKTPFAITSRDLSNQNWIIASSSDQRPTHFYLYHRKNKELTFLFSTQPALEKYPLCQMKPISFQARDGMNLHGYLTLPLNKGTTPVPAVLFVHGGPCCRDSWGLNPVVQWLANRGYAVLQINFRGSSGYGKKYQNAGNREWGAKMHTDLLDGKQWMAQQGIVDPNRVAIFGGSYGGYATLVGLAFTPDEFCCGVDIVGPSNLVTMLQTFPPYWSPAKVQMDRRVGTLESDMALLKERSPLFKAHQIKKPLLIAQGANDPRVKQAESDQIVEAMRQNQLPVEYLLFPDEGHGFARPENRLKFYRVAEEFLSKYLKTTGSQYVTSEIK